MNRREQKKRAQKAGLIPWEQEVLDLIEELLERFAMLEVLCFSNNFLITDRTQIPPEERERIFRAAVRAVAPESPVELWRERLGRLKGEILDKKREIRRERKKERLGKTDPLEEEDAGA